jgi:hypothetical protein
MMETKWFRTLISRTDLSRLKKEFLAERSKKKITGKINDLFLTKKHYFIETGSAEDLKDFFLEFEFIECTKPREKMDKLM